MDDTAPLFTVVVPLYNAEAYIVSTLRSVLAQTEPDFEVLVVDDGSTDGGPALVRGLMREDARIALLTQANRGLSGARNTGIRHARGRFIALLDADDAWHPSKLARHREHLAANRKLGVSFSCSRLIDEQGRDLGLVQTARLVDIDAEHVFCRNPVGNGSAAVLRRAALDDIAFSIETEEGPRTCWFDETFRQSEDIELWTRMIVSTTWEFGGIAEALTLYRINSGGLSADPRKQFASWCRFRDKLATYAPDLIRDAGKRAEAYQRRYLARRSAMDGRGRAALALVLGGLRAYPRMVAEEPSKTVLTLALASFAYLLPRRAFDALKGAIFKTLRSLKLQVTAISRPRPVTTTP